MTAAMARAARDAAWSERAASFAVFLSLGLCTGAWAASLPAFKAELGLSDGDLSLALFALAIGSIGATLATGIVASRLGTRLSTAIGLVAVAGNLALLPLAGTLASFASVAFAVGASMGLLDVSMNGHASALEERWGSPLMSSFHGAFSLGGLGGAALGGLLAAAGQGAAGQLWIPLVIVGLCDVAALPFLGRGAPPSVKTPAATPAFALPRGAALSLGAVAAFCFLVEGAMADWSAVFLATVAQSGTGGASTGYAAFSISMAVVRFAGDRVVAAIGSRRILVGGGTLAAAGLALAVAIPHPVVSAVGFAFVGLGLGNVAPVAFGAAGRRGRTPAEGVAPVATVGYAGFLLGPPLIGLISAAAGLRFALGCLVIVAAVVAVLGRSVEDDGRA